MQLLMIHHQLRQDRTVSISLALHPSCAVELRHPQLDLPFPKAAANPTPRPVGRYGLVPHAPYQSCHVASGQPAAPAAIAVERVPAAEQAATGAEVNALHGPNMMRWKGQGATPDNWPNFLEIVKPAGGSKSAWTSLYSAASGQLTVGMLSGRPR